MDDKSAIIIDSNLKNVTKALHVPKRVPKHIQSVSLLRNR